MSRVHEAVARTLKDWTTPDEELLQPGEAAAEAAKARFPSETPNRSAPAPPVPRKSADTGATAPSGVVGAMVEECPGLFARLDSSKTEKLVIGGMQPDSVEQYRRCAAALHQMQSERGIKTVLVTSAVPAEGKTLTACNLALTLSESYRRRVLLIDADLRRPAVHDLFGIPNVTGLSDWLKATSLAGLRPTELSATLAVIPSGRSDPDPMRSLTSQRMQRLVSENAGLFDWIIIDTPPVGLLPDASLLAAAADAVVLVVRAGATPHAMVQRALEATGREKVVGIVLNGIPAALLHGGYGYDNYYTGPLDRTS